MPHQKFIILIGLILSISVFSFGQTTNQNESPTVSKDEKEKARVELENKAFALAERAASDAATLKLANNRAYVLAMVGDLLWKQDQKRARNLFRNAASELVAANAEADKNEADDQTAMFGFYNSPRRTILQTVARRDAELALELLMQTRSPKIVAEMQKQNVATNAGQSRFIRVLDGMNALRMQAQEELQLEQSLTVLAAEQDPKRAAKLIRDSFQKGISFEALNLVRKIHEKDDELANTLLTEIAQKILESDFSKQTAPERQVAIQFLRQYGQSKDADVKNSNIKKQPLKLDDKLLHDLANKTIDNLLKPNAAQPDFGFNPYFEISALSPILEKLAPERAGALQQKQIELKKSMPEGMRGFSDFNLLNDPKATPDKLIAGAGKLPAGSGMRTMFYRRAIDQLAQKGDVEQAKQLLGNAPSGKERDDALSYLDGKLAEKAAQAGKYDEARQIISGINKKSVQIEQLVKLALIFNAKNDQDSRKTAEKLIDEARGTIVIPPEDADDIQNLTQVVAGYAVIAPERAFNLLEPLVDQANELAQAAALLAKFQKNQFMFRDGEMLLAAGMGQMLGQMRFTKELGLLAAADFEKTRDLADRFQRNDLRILARLLIAQSLLKATPEAPQNAFGAGPAFVLSD